MTGATLVRARCPFVVMNPASGGFVAEAVHAALDRRLVCGDRTCEVHVTTGPEDLAGLARSAVERGCDLVVAAGGDGTVSCVADGLVGTGVPLAILPLGTANVLARELGIPLDLDAACALLAGDFAIASIDAMTVRGKHVYTQLGVGLDALMIRDTTRESKRHFGRLAYLATAVVRLLGFQPRRFRLFVDGTERRPRASQILLANCGTLGQPPLRWGPEIRPDDGRIDICIVRAQTLLDYLGLARDVVLGRHHCNRNVRYLKAERIVAVSTKRPLPVQADGEIIGATPIEVRVVPRALRVVVPVV
jgi:YegS/Rv2252/BmrU family lipid kinase